VEFATLLAAAVAGKHLPEQDTVLFGAAVVDLRVEGLIGPLAPGAAGREREMVQSLALVALRGLGVTEEWVHVDPPEKIARTYLDRKKKRVPHVAGIASAVTQHIVVVRVLGEARKVRCPNITCIYVNGNNLIIGAGMTRRVIGCEMDAKVERPETRKFKDNRLLDTVRTNRVQLVIAGLTILRAWLVARPTTTIDLTLLDFFERSARTRSALVWLGCADPGGTMQASRANDPYQVQRSVVIAEWNRVLGRKEFLQRDIIAAASGDPPLFASGDPALLAALMASRLPEAGYLVYAKFTLVVGVRLQEPQPWIGERVREGTLIEIPQNL
jgi:hypothetical protein